MKSSMSYWNIFRLIFVCMFLYLMGDAFYRWDGFSYYGSFYDFLFGLNLVSIIWGVATLLVAFIVWLPVRTLDGVCQRMGWKIAVKHLMFFIYVTVFLVVMVLIGKRIMFGGLSLSSHEKWIIVLSIIFFALLLSFFIRKKTELLLKAVQERITPLVWLFSIFVISSVPLVAIHTWWKEADIVQQKPVQNSAVNENRQNIILVTFDAMTAKDMSVYEYNRETTPFIAEWAKKATVFTRVHAASNYTSPTMASLMTGKRVWTHQLFHAHAFKPAKSNIENMPLLLKNKNYYNMAFVQNSFASVRTLGVRNSFDIAPLVTEFSVPLSIYNIIDNYLYRLFGNKIRLYNWIIQNDFITGKYLIKISKKYSDFSKTEVPPVKPFNKFLKIIDGNNFEPFFAWIHLYPPHDPYLAPEPYSGMFDSSDNLRTYYAQANGIYEIINHSPVEQKYFSQKVKPTVDILRTRYDEFIRYCDNEFKDFISQLGKRNILEKSIVILTSDHGESFQHNYLLHGKTHLYEQVTHIPLIIKEPNQTERRIVTDLVGQIDIPATILDLASISVPSWMEGRSLLPLVRGEKLQRRPSFSMNFERNMSRGSQIKKGTVAVWEGEYKLIHYLEDDKNLLFNLKQDYEELNDLFDKESDTGLRLLDLIHVNLKMANAKIINGE